MIHNKTMCLSKAGPALLMLLMSCLLLLSAGLREVAAVSEASDAAAAAAAAVATPAEVADATLEPQLTPGGIIASKRERRRRCRREKREFLQKQCPNCDNSGRPDVCRSFCELHADKAYQVCVYGEYNY